MQFSFYAILQIIIFTALVISLVILFFKLGRRIGRLETEKKFERQIKIERDDAVKRSRSVLTGQINEQIAPFLPDFPCDPADCRFIGKPVDFIAFSGLSKSDCVQEVLLIEVKTAKSTLTKREKEVQKAIMEGRVRYIQYRI